MGRGNTSDIVEWGRYAVVKVLHPGIPAEWAEVEAETIRLVRAAGLPAPAVHGVVTVAGRPGIVLDRVDGPSLWDRMVAEPARLAEWTGILVGLQRVLLATPAPAGLSSVAGRIRHQLDSAPLGPQDRKATAAVLTGLPDGAALCHFDLHPDNVILAASGPVVVDWFDAAAGDPAADVARSSVLMRAETAVGHLRQAPVAFLRRLHAEYLHRAVGVLGVSPGEVDRWERPLLAARLTEPLPAPVRDATLRMLRERSGVAALGVADPVTRG